MGIFLSNIITKILVAKVGGFKHKFLVLNANLRLVQLVFNEIYM